MKELILPLEKKFNEPIVLGLGFFDCVHIGHRQLISRIEYLSKKLNAKRAITTFSNNPYKLFNYESKLIYTYAERKTLFSSVGLEYCVPFKFNTFFKAIEYEDFLSMLFSSLNIAGIVCGYDYLFGRGGHGNTTLLEKVCKAKGIVIEVIEPVIVDDERVSSTLVKECLQKGNIKRANSFLAEPYFMDGVVVEGRGEGKKLGFPTANLLLKKDKMLPLYGVYATNANVDGIKMRAVTSIGAKPTFSQSSISIETYINGKDINLYGKQIRIEFLDRIRSIAKFSSPEELAKQIKDDISKNLAQN